MVVFVALLILHHDWWFWTDGRLVFGFLPIGLAYHMLISIAAGRCGAGRRGTHGRRSTKTDD